MNHDRYRLPSRVGKLLSMLPAYPGSVLFVAGLNLALVKHLPVDVQQSLAGKTLRIKVVDAQLAFDFIWRKSTFAPCRNSGEADLMIGASAHDFLLLAQRREDPDTLFFSRRLVMEGDTELGLLVKNTLDAIESPLFNLDLLAPVRVLERFRPAARQAKDGAH
ncbi:MAG: sterol-binding protein [Burkholderiales bacterium RIFCSPLOWO2_02_FULL_57_36]|nr:MAG: sterol-binding protein [Burkholderiales bacterium RIFCSPLOWO2_02_FULL_57_36]